MALFIEMEDNSVGGQLLLGKAQLFVDFFVAVFVVAEHEVADKGEMCADLVGAAGDELNL